MFHFWWGKLIPLNEFWIQDDVKMIDIAKCAKIREDSIMLWFFMQNQSVLDLPLALYGDVNLYDHIL